MRERRRKTFESGRRWRRKRHWKIKNLASRWNQSPANEAATLALSHFDFEQIAKDLWGWKENKREEKEEEEKKFEELCMRVSETFSQRRVLPRDTAWLSVPFKSITREGLAPCGTQTEINIYPDPTKAHLQYVLHCRQMEYFPEVEVWRRSRRGGGGGTCHWMLF